VHRISRSGTGNPPACVEGGEHESGQDRRIGLGGNVRGRCVWRLDGHATRRDVAEAIGGRAVRGTAEQVAEQIKTNVLDVGVDGVIVNLPTHGYTPGVITKLGEALRPLVSA